MYSYSVMVVRRVENLRICQRKKGVSTQAILPRYCNGLDEKSHSSTRVKTNKTMADQRRMERDLSLGQIVLQRGQAANAELQVSGTVKTDEEIKQEALLLQASQNGNFDDSGQVTSTEDRVADPGGNKKNGSVSSIKPKDYASGKRDKNALPEVAARQGGPLFDKNMVSPDGTRRVDADEVKTKVISSSINHDDYVSSEGEDINLLEIVAQRSNEASSTHPPMMPLDPRQSSGKTPSAPGVSRPGAFAGAPGAKYRPMEPARLDVLTAVADVEPARLRVPKAASAQLRATALPP
jgi:hypothetical protein